MDRLNFILRGCRKKWRNSMGINEMMQCVYSLLKIMKIKIKSLSDEEFAKILSDNRLDYTQRLYLIYFRYM